MVAQSKGMTPADQTQVSSILEFWFGKPQLDDSYEQRRNYWFSKQLEFDAAIRRQFLGLYEQAAAGELESWSQTPEGSLALILIFDQFPRNMFRDSPQAFATDSRALALARQAVSAGFDHQLTPLQRIFLYLPFEHSEQLADQTESLRLFKQLCTAAPELSDIWDYALRHQAVIERFGRYPHRNAILGRDTTPEEAAFLQQPGSRF